MKSPHSGLPALGSPLQLCIDGCHTSTQRPETHGQKEGIASPPQSHSSCFHPFLCYDFQQSLTSLEDLSTFRIKMYLWRPHHVPCFLIPSPVIVCIPQLRSPVCIPDEAIPRGQTCVYAPRSTRNSSSSPSDDWHGAISAPRAEDLKSHSSSMEARV